MFPTYYISHLIRHVIYWAIFYCACNLVPRVFVPLAQRLEDESSGSKPFQACAIDADCAVKPDGQNSVISKWLLPELSFFDRWSRATKTLDTRLPSALILPHFDYCSPVWDGMSGCLSDKLQKLQNRAAREITQSPFDTSSNLLLAMLKWEKLSLRRRSRKL